MARTTSINLLGDKMAAKALCDAHLNRLLANFRRLNEFQDLQQNQQRVEFVGEDGALYGSVVLKTVFGTETVEVFVGSAVPKDIAGDSENYITTEGPVPVLILVRPVVDVTAGTLVFTPDFSTVLWDENTPPIDHKTGRFLQNPVAYEIEVTELVNIGAEGWFLEDSESLQDRYDPGWPAPAPIPNIYEATNEPDWLGPNLGGSWWLEGTSGVVEDCDPPGCPAHLSYGDTLCSQAPTLGVGTTISIPSWSTFLSGVAPASGYDSCSFYDCHWVVGVNWMECVCGSCASCLLCDCETWTVIENVFKIHLGDSGNRTGRKYDTYLSSIYNKVTGDVAVDDIQQFTTDVVDTATVSFDPLFGTFSREKTTRDSGGGSYKDKTASVVGVDGYEDHKTFLVTYFREVVDAWSTASYLSTRVGWNHPLWQTAEGSTDESSYDSASKYTYQFCASFSGDEHVLVAFDSEGPQNWADILACDIYDYQGEPVYVVSMLNRFNDYHDNTFQYFFYFKGELSKSDEYPAIWGNKVGGISVWSHEVGADLHNADWLGTGVIRAAALKRSFKAV